MGIESIWVYIKNGLPHPSWAEILVLFAGLTTVSKGVEDFLGKKSVGNWIITGFKKFFLAPWMILKSIDELQTELKQIKERTEARQITNQKMIQEILINQKVTYELDEVMKFMIDEHGMLHSPNRSLLAYFGFTERDLKGRNWENYMDNSEMEMIAQRLHRAMKNKSEFISEHFVLTPENTREYCRIKGIPLIDSDKKILGFMGQIEVIET